MAGEGIGAIESKGMSEREVDLPKRINLQKQVEPAKLVNLTKKVQDDKSQHSPARELSVVPHDVAMRPPETQRSHNDTAEHAVVVEIDGVDSQPLGVRRRRTQEMAERRQYAEDIYRRRNAIGEQARRSIPEAERRVLDQYRILYYAKNGHPRPNFRVEQIRYGPPPLGTLVAAAVSIAAALWIWTTCDTGWLIAFRIVAALPLAAFAIARVIHGASIYRAQFCYAKLLRKHGDRTPTAVQTWLDLVESEQSAR
ncbi:hypothetical protein HH308_18240 [Gordonia sp. TBRC 11910]|uniref:Uncharacterized protein n=1 Tax=Gordonia asplenii TaxID=2725283 RepID=A0A848KWY9_9ACTN|nr:hypothetical protein [Gordonia asplenii]NMO03156.1 hypothetical protein [Gordonia asplenii]